MNKTRIKSGTRLRDVAEAAGVSMATVSAVVNGHADQYGIALATRQRVEELIRQMDYTPSIAARDMAAGRNPLLGLAIAANAPATDQLIAAIQIPLTVAGYRLMVTHLPADATVAATLIDDFMHAGIAGLIYCPAATGSSPLPDADCPTIAIGMPVTGFPAIYEDEREAGRRLARRLLDKGHRAIAVVGVTTPQTPVVGGFAETCAQAGVTPRLCGSVPEYIPLMGAIPAAFCVSSATLLELYCQSLGAGRRPGTDLAVVAADKQGLASHLIPRPVAYQPNTTQLGQAAARFIQLAIQGSTPGDVRLDPVISEGDSISMPVVKPIIVPIPEQAHIVRPQPEPQAQARPVVIPTPVIPIPQPIAPVPVAAAERASHIEEERAPAESHPMWEGQSPAATEVEGNPVDTIAEALPQTPDPVPTMSPEQPEESIPVPEPVIEPEPVTVPDPVVAPELVIPLEPAPIPDPEPAPEVAPPVVIAPPPEPPPPPVEPAIVIVEEPAPVTIAVPLSPIEASPVSPPEVIAQPPVVAEPLPQEPEVVIENVPTGEPEAPSDPIPATGTEVPQA